MIEPGEMAFTRIFGDRSMAMWHVNFNKAAFAVP